MRSGSISAIFYYLPIVLLVLLPFSALIIDWLTDFKNDGAFKVVSNGVITSLSFIWLTLVVVIFKKRNTVNYRILETDFLYTYGRHNPTPKSAGGFEYPNKAEVLIKKYVMSAIISVVLLLFCLWVVKRPAKVLRTSGYFYYEDWLKKLSKGIFPLVEQIRSLGLVDDDVKYKLHKGPYDKDELNYLIKGDITDNLDNCDPNEELCGGDIIISLLGDMFLFVGLPIIGLYLYTILPFGLNTTAPALTELDYPIAVCMYWLLLFLIPFFVQTLKLVFGGMPVLQVYWDGNELNEETSQIDSYGPDISYFHSDHYNDYGQPELNCGEDKNINIKDLSVYQIHKYQESCKNDGAGDCSFVIDSGGKMHCLTSEYIKGGEAPTHSNCPPCPEGEGNCLCNKFFPSACDNGLMGCYKKANSDEAYEEICNSINLYPGRKEYCGLNNNCEWYESCLDNPPPYNNYGEVKYYPVSRVGYASCSKISNWEDYYTTNLEERDFNTIFELQNNLEKKITESKPCLNSNKENGHCDLAGGCKT